MCLGGGGNSAPAPTPPVPEAPKPPLEVTPEQSAKTANVTGVPKTNSLSSLKMVNQSGGM